MGHSASSPSISIYASYANSSATATAICAAMTVDGVTSETCKGLPPGPTQTSGATTESAVSKLPDTAQGGQGGKEVVGNEEYEDPGTQGGNDGQGAKDGAAKGFKWPQAGGGSMLTTWLNPDSLGEPLNLIVSGESDADVLVDRKLKGGFRNYMLSGSMSDEAFGIHLGDPQLANLGDGKGSTKQIRELRHNYGEIIFGTLTETLIGGNHLRYWQQDGTKAYFLAASAEKNVSEHHDIVPDGYDLGRDQFVAKLVGYDLKSKPRIGQTFSGESRAFGWIYRTDVEYIEGLAGIEQATINHHDTMSVDGKATDGLVAVLTVRIKKRGLF